jgi:hypothetical protein
MSVPGTFVSTTLIVTPSAGFSVAAMNSPDRFAKCSVTPRPTHVAILRANACACRKFDQCVEAPRRRLVVGGASPVVWCLKRHRVRWRLRVA